MHGILFTTRRDSKRFCLKSSEFYQDSKKNTWKKGFEIPIFFFDSTRILPRLKKKVQDSALSLKGF